MPRHGPIRDKLRQPAKRELHECDWSRNNDILLEAQCCSIKLHHQFPINKIAQQALLLYDIPVHSTYGVKFSIVIIGSVRSSRTDGALDTSSCLLFCSVSLIQY